MSSRLFHAIVGVGVSFGAAACSVAVDLEAADAASAATDAPETSVVHDSATEPDVKVSDAGIDALHDADAFLDAKTDAKADGPSDAMADAFCDAAWPTTKGTPQRPACTNPQGTCVWDGGWVSSSESACYDLIGPFQCEGSETWNYCINGQWECPTGKLQASECRCYGPTPPGYVCTKEGFKLIDAGP